MDKCSLNAYFEGECDICNKFPNEEALVKLRECNKVISGHLRQCKLAEKSFPSEAELLSCRAGIWKWKKETDRGTTVCPFHRYNYGIGWRPSMKCGFPNHPVDSRCKPQRGMTAAMCEVAQLRWGFLCRVGTGICRQCMNDVLSEDKDPSFENLQLEKVDDHDDSCVSAKEVFNDEVLHGHSESTTYLDIDSEGDCFSQATNASNWSAEEGVNDLDNINHAVSLLSHGTTSPVRAQLSISLETAKESTIRYYKRKADEACNYFCELIAPTQGKKLKSLVSNDLSSNEDSSFDTLDNIKKLFENSNDSMVRTQILSVVVNQYSKAELLSLIPGLTKHQIDKARKHAFMFGPGKKDETAVSTTLHRQKMDRTKMVHAVEFFCTRHGTVLVCENKELSISCPAGARIRIQQAVYGRLDSSDHDPCPFRQAFQDCRSPNSMSFTKNMCQDQQSCNINATNKYFKGDPCPNTHKYLIVKYICKASVYGCETSNLTLTCPTGKKIHIQDAIYGRIEPSTEDPCPGNSGVKYCRSPYSTSVTKQLCEGQQKCHIYVDPKTFYGDPCKSVSKYLKVQYACIN